MAHESMDWREHDADISLTKIILIGSATFLFVLFAAGALSHERQLGAAGEPGPELAATPELPREWVPEREAVTFDHMFRSGQSAVE
jgi:hypothetical protein